MPYDNGNLWHNLKAGDVISLWDIVAQFTKSIDGARFFELIQSLQSSVISTDLTSKGIVFNDVSFTQDTLEEAFDFCTFFGLSVAGRMLSSQINLVKTEGKVLIPQEAYSLVMAIRSELEGVTFVAIDPDKKKYWNDNEIILPLHAKATFPESIYDLVEGQKCFAVHRFTACVFHLIRAVEAIVKVLAQEVGATFIDKHGKTLSWGILLSNIKGKIDKMDKGDVQTSWYRAHELLHSVNVSLRTPTNHPKATYTEEEAFAVINSVKVCLPELARLIS